MINLAKKVGLPIAIFIAVVVLILLLAFVRPRTAGGQVISTVTSISTPNSAP